MVSPESIRRYAFFSGLNHEQITILSKSANESSYEAGHYFFHENEKLAHFFLIIEGSVTLNLEITDRQESQPISQQLAGEVKTREITVSTLGAGEVFGMSGLIPPNNSTACAKAVTSCKIIKFDCKNLIAIFESDCEFGYLITQKAAQVIQDRLRNIYIESLANLAE